MNEAKNHVICIIGMHRSGTSMVTRLLNLCGLYLGPDDKLVTSLKGNLRGHWENSEFLRLNEALLARLGGTWDNPPDLPAGWQHDASLSDLAHDARLMVQEYFPSGVHWGWKEPRTTLLIPFWETIIPRLRFVIVIRDPLNVALSLEKRDGIPIQHGSQLWYRYMMTAAKETDNCDRLFTFYDDYFNEPLTELARVVNFCGLELPADLSGIMGTIDQDLRHQRNAVQELLGHPSILDEVKLYYLGSLALTRHSDGKTRDHIGDDNRNVVDTQNVQKLTEVVINLSTKLKLLEEKKIHNEDLPVWVNELNATISQQQKTIIDQRQWIARMQSTTQQLEHLIALRDKQLVETQQVLVETQEVLGVCDKQLAEIRSSLLWRYTAPLRALRRLLINVGAKVRGR